MENSNNEIFKTKIFYEFFIYCMEKRLQYNMDVTDKTSLEFNESEKTVSVVIPKNINEYNEEVIFNGWKNIIKNIESENKINEMLNYLENLTQ
jgi:hypothetical protein